MDFSSQISFTNVHLDAALFALGVRETVDIVSVLVQAVLVFPHQRAVQVQRQVVLFCFVKDVLVNIYIYILTVAQKSDIICNTVSLLL